MRTSRAVIAALTLVVALAACGDDDDAPSASEPAPAPTVESSSPESPSSPGSTPSGEVAPPNATIAPELPEELEGEVGPVEVRGESLPGLGNGTAITDDPALGLSAPVLIGEDFDGTPVRVDAASDGPAMVVFLAHWCPHCNAEVPRLNELRDEGAFPPGLDIIAVSTAMNPGRPNYPPSQWFEDVDWTYPVLVDGIDMERETYIAADAYGVDGFPFIVLLDGDGNVVARWSGEREPDEVIALIEEALPDL